MLHSSASVRKHRYLAGWDACCVARISRLLSHPGFCIRSLGSDPEAIYAEPNESFNCFFRAYECGQLEVKYAGPDRSFG